MEVTKKINQEALSSMIAEKVWGHRFRNGQRGVEYTLEFLNVISGTNYKLDEPVYKRKKMVEFRKFIFEGEKEGRETKNQDNYVSFDPSKKAKIAQSLGIEVDQLSEIQSFLNNMKVDIRQQDGSKVNRSWYAQFLFPLNEAMLFYELRNKNGTISYERNFFSRGGELYYIALSYGTKNNKQLKDEIELKLKKLLSQNKNIANIITKISEVVDEKTENDTGTKDLFPLFAENKVTGEKYTNYPKLAMTESPLFELMAQEINSLLSTEFDIHDAFKFMTSLICIQIYRYMIQRCESITEEKQLILMDCTDGQNPHIRRIAQKSFKTHQQIVMKAFDKYVTNHIDSLLPPGTAIEKIKEWKQEAKNSQETLLVKKYEKFFKEMEYNKLQEKNKTLLIEALENEDEDYAYKLLLIKMTELARQKQQKDDFSILGVLGRDGGFLTTGKGIQGRYTLSDTLLISLVLALLNNEPKMTFDRFKNKLYKQFNIVIGVEEAQKSGVCDIERINLGSFKDNEQRLRNKLRKNGLLEEFSDATAFVVNPAYMNGGI